MFWDQIKLSVQVHHRSISPQANYVKYSEDVKQVEISGFCIEIDYFSLDILFELSD